MALGLLVALVGFGLVIFVGCTINYREKYLTALSAAHNPGERIPLNVSCHCDKVVKILNQKVFFSSNFLKDFMAWPIKSK